MNEKTKRILICRKIREVVTVKRDERLIFICENCQSEQIFKLAATSDTKSLNDGETPESKVLPTENKFNLN